MTKELKIKVKEWVIEKAQNIATSYNCFIDTYGKENDYVTVWAFEVLSETEKAIQVKLSTGAVVGSGKGWKVWLPKSQIAEMVELEAIA